MLASGHAAYKSALGKVRKRRQLCLACGYPRLSSIGVCPECGCDPLILPQKIGCCIFGVFVLSISTMFIIADFVFSRAQLPQFCTTPIAITCIRCKVIRPELRVHCLTELSRRRLLLAEYRSLAMAAMDLLAQEEFFVLFPEIIQSTWYSSSDGESYFWFSLWDCDNIARRGMQNALSPHDAARYINAIKLAKNRSLDKKCVDICELTMCALNNDTASGTAAGTCDCEASSELVSYTVRRWSLAATGSAKEGR
jgi:hypothetical protein